MTVKPGSYEWNEAIAGLFEATGDIAVHEALHRVISSVVSLESFIVFHYHHAGIPDILYENIRNRDRQNNLENYLDGAYLLDPFYQHFCDSETSGVVTLQEVAPDHFRKSEYYRSYYKFSGLKDEVNIYIQLSGTSSIVIALGRIQGRAAFTKKDVGLLRDLLPILRSVCLRHWRGADLTAGEEDKSNSRFSRGLENFGTSCLSVKESEVLHLLLMGHSAKSTAARMGISPGTVKIHRNNIYAKLDINSQTELFSLFIGAMAHMKGDGSEDPLIAFHQQSL